MLKSAVIGTGFMGITHVEALRRLGIEVVGLLGINDEETRSAVVRLSLRKAYLGLEELLADPEISVVHICTPNYLHYPMAKAVLKAGKHVMCEKPLANNSQEVDDLVRLEKDTGLVGAVNYNLRFYPLNQEARGRIQAGEMGEINIVHGEYCQDWLLLPTDWNWRLEPELGGDLRVVADIGTHWMDLVTWLTNLEISAVFADFHTFLPTRYKPIKEEETFANKLGTGVNTGKPIHIHTEDYAAMLFEFSNGARGTLMLSQISPGRKNDCRWEFNGSKASMSWRQENPNELWIGHREKPNELLLKDPALMQPDARLTAAYPGGHAEGYPDTFVQIFKSLYGYIAAGKYGKPRSFATFKDGRRELILCETIQQSANEGRWVQIRY
jgi:predicted dehydrogenase